MCSPMDFARLHEENGQAEAWDLAGSIAEMSHIIRMQLFHEYELKKILHRYTYSEARKILADNHWIKE